MIHVVNGDWDRPQNLCHSECLVNRFVSHSCSHIGNSTVQITYICCCPLGLKYEMIVTLLYSYIQDASGWLVRRSSWFEPRTVHVEFVTLGQVGLRPCRFSPFIIIPSLFHILHPQGSSCREAKRTKPDKHPTISSCFINRVVSWRKCGFVAFTEACVLHRYCNLDKMCYVM